MHLRGIGGSGVVQENTHLTIILVIIIKFKDIVNKSGWAKLGQNNSSSLLSKTSKQKNDNSRENICTLI